VSILAFLTGDGQAFNQQAWGVRTHLHEVGPALSDLLGLDDVDHLVTSTAIRTPSIRIVRDGQVLGSNRYTRRASLAGQPLTGLVDVRRALDLVSDGATLVLQGLQRSWPPITRALAQLEDELGHPCQANAYLTPPGSSGFDVHADRHDVFVAQTHGRKSWRVFEGPDDDSGRDLELEAGTCLYLPAGTRHAAATGDHASLHVTIGVKAITWRDVLHRTVDRVVDEVAGDLQSGGPRLPIGHHRDPDGVAAGAADHLVALAERLALVDPHDVAAHERDRVLTSRPTILPGGLKDRLALGGLADDTRLARRPTTTAGTRMVGDRVHLLLGDRRLAMPAWVAPALERIAEADELCPKDLADLLDESSRLVLTRRLVREGLLEFAS